MRLHVLWRVIVKELMQLRRDRKMIPALIVGPIVQLVALGFAANTDVTSIPMLLIDQDHSAASRELAARFTGSGYFQLVGGGEALHDVDDWLIAGDAQIALVIGWGYGAAVAGGGRPRVQVIADGSDSSSATVGLGYASRIVAEAGADLVRARQAAGVGRGVRPVGRITVVPRVWYNPDLKSRWFYVPAVLAMVLMLTTMVLPSMAIVREKEIGTMEQLIVTPVRAAELVAGKLLPFAAIGLVDTLLISAVAVWLFDVPLRGSLVLLLFLTALFLGTTLGLGLLVSSLAATQQQAMLTATYLLMVPMIYLSGLIFPIENMPTVIQYATYVIPLRYYAIIVRGLFLKGVGLEVLWPQAVALGGFALLVFAAASRRFRKSLD